MADTPDSYLAKLPKTEAEITALTIQRNEALYQLGLLYRAKFNENELAIQRLERVLALKPAPDIEVVSLYELYKNYLDTQNPKAAAIKAQLLANYDGTDYAKLLQGGETSQQERNKMAQQFADTLTAQYKRGEIEEVAQQLQTEAMRYHETDAAPAIALLQAQTIGRLEGVAHYREELQQIVTNYPATAESEEAQQLLEELKEVDNEPFVDDEKATKWKVVIMGTTLATREEVKKEILEKINTISEVLTLSTDVYKAGETWLVIHHLRDEYSAQSVVNELNSLLQKYKLTTFIIATENYRLVQLRKDKEKYLSRQTNVK